ncbi:hypothetical protein [Methylocystis sp.]|uniref:hypothetical protein n=1 Tax=Methylocystis sp. TaxID=1911079 RepID=UPI003DA60257
MSDEPRILIPFDRDEAIPIRIMALLAGISEQTARNWCAEHGLGRRIGGRWWGSRVALAMFQDGDKAALRAYHAGQRDGRVADYFDRARAQKLKNLQSAQSSSGA